MERRLKDSPWEVLESKPVGGETSYTDNRVRPRAEYEYRIRNDEAGTRVTVRFDERRLDDVLCDDHRAERLLKRADALWAGDRKAGRDLYRRIIKEYAGAVAVRKRRADIMDRAR